MRLPQGLPTFNRTLVRVDLIITTVFGLSMDYEIFLLSRIRERYERTGEGRYRQADTGRELRITTGTGQPDAVADRERQAASFARRNPSYERIRIEPVDYQGVEAADWEFTFEGLHVLNRVFVVDGTGHSLWLQTPEDDYSAARADFDAIVDGFSPGGG